MIAAAVALVAGVLVPDLGPSPGSYERGWLGQALLVVAMIAVGFFVAVIVTREKRVARGGSLWGPYVVAVLVMVVPLSIVFLMDRAGEGWRSRLQQPVVC